MNVEVFLTGSHVTEEDVEGRTVVVIDVLRASSTIITALANGARAVIPVADMDQAGKIAMNLDPSTYLLGGERDGDRIDGYHLGNSPLEYTPDVVEGKTIILNTTNGTRAIWNARNAEHLIVGSFLNADRVVQFVREVGLDVTIICAGRNNRVALDDALCAGLILHRLWEGREPEYVSDAAHIALTQYLHDRDRLADALRHSNHARWLIEKGYGADVEYCLQLDALPVLPYYRENRLVLYRERQPSESTG
ncbi:2-phosphosulfolactate phosphatase [Rhodothermus marinus SG0.5JP17-172]|jgi:2-phosphosulfolactate phosphatase|uniref:2-phosphosulfolactate phosphatase n=1 Tax=Rhodothermus marinus TaxID=29549 RepID=UPI000223DC69|nr:2-phosphosulfolactate phosphatase [Rhodothermus marinus]AEN73675.1 2-phosphosulfolactate phosphatase [Rhodothermus marinus SG0.5JP17-172]